MKSSYKIPLHVKKYIQTELYDYKKNKKLIVMLKEEFVHTRPILLTLQRINKIDKVYKKLSKEEREAFEKIFIEKHNQIYAETHDNLTKDMYYNIKNKIIYLTAIEFDLF